MSNFTWSDEQKLAIEYASSNVLISAGAGSGKTAVLTERVYHLIKNGADITRFLILTFSKDASAEMKKRVRKRLLEDPTTRHLAPLAEAAHIETFDAFALFLVKKYSHKIGVSPNIKIIDNNILKITKSKFRDEVLTHYNKEKNETLIGLIKNYCFSDYKILNDFIDELINKAELSEDKYHFLDNLVDKYFNEKVVNLFIDAKLSIMQEAINYCIRLSSEIGDVKDYENISNYLDELRKNMKDFDQLTSTYENLKFPIKPKSATDTYVRETIKSVIERNLIKYEEYGSKDEIVSSYLKHKDEVALFAKIAREVIEKVDEFQKDKAAYSFSDVANMALRVLDIVEVSKEMRDYFQYILVDEYQDTSMLQEKVIQKLSKNNVCMVGDVKQSIYGFRNADCTIFQQKYDAYKNNDGGYLINLNKSYRSRKEVVDLVNEMFSDLMIKATNPIDYKDGHVFEYGFKEYDTLVNKNQNYCLDIYDYDIVKGQKNGDIESEIMANDIINKINNKFQVYDKDTHKLRDASFKDFAVIMAKGKRFKDIKKTFAKYGIPTRVTYDEPVKESPIAYVIKNLLIIYRGLLKDEIDDSFIHAYTSISRSFLYRYKDEDIYKTVKNNSFKNSEICETIYRFLDEVRYSPLSTILKRTVEEFDIYRKVGRITQFASNTNKVELFISLTKSMDELGYDIDDLVQYFEDIDELDLEIPYVDSDVSEDSVTLITMHRSKGLEYPIIYLPQLDGKSQSESSSAFIVDDTFGPIIPNSGMNQKSSLLLHMHKTQELKKRYEERLRLFYVAVTRAREKVIMLYGVNNKKENLLFPLPNYTYARLINIIGLNNKYGHYFDFSPTHLNTKEENVTRSDIKMKTVHVEPVLIEKKRASKDRDDNISDDLLEFGNEIHYLLEIANYETKDLSFISNPRIKRYINNVLSSKLFENVKNSEVLHEFSFFDEKNNTNGIIDCLVKKDDEIDIIDFKLKNIDDDKYILQLHTYKDYISQITNLKIKMYLISAITGEVKEVV